MKQTALRTALFVLTLLVTMSCAKSPRCSGDDSNKGIIESEVLIGCEPAVTEDGYLITNQREYEALFDTAGQLFPCSLPEIDFSKHSVLGLQTSGQCQTKTIHEVEKVEKDKKYHYCCVMKSCGTCKSLVISFNWVLVPKLPDGWTVTFEKKEK